MGFASTPALLAHSSSAVPTCMERHPVRRNPASLAKDSAYRLPARHVLSSAVLRASFPAVCSSTTSFFSITDLQERPKSEFWRHCRGFHGALNTDDKRCYPSQLHTHSTRWNEIRVRTWCYSGRTKLPNKSQMSRGNTSRLNVPSLSGTRFRAHILSLQWAGFQGLMFRKREMVVAR